MERKVAAFINKGMSRDLAISKASDEFAFDNQNIRITPDKESTLLSVSNEKGTYKVPGIRIKGTVIGYCVCNERLLVFSTFRKHQDSNPEYPDEGKTYSPDYLTLIYNKVEKSGVRLVGEILYEGDLGLSMDHPVETLFNYETGTVQKVYWVDGVHQVRYINIVAEEEERDNWVIQQAPFDIMRPIRLEETVSITKTDLYALFPSGVLQYFLTYSKYNGNETPVFWQSGLIYLNSSDRGLSKEEFCNTAISVTVTNLDTSWDRLNVYSIIRPELNGVPQARKMSYDIVKSSLTFLDTNLAYESIDPSAILYNGGDLIYPYTITAKENVLFLGNNKIDRQRLPDEILEEVKQYCRITEAPIQIAEEDFQNLFYGYDNYDFLRNTAEQQNTDAVFYPYVDYDLAIQFQNNLGIWYEPVYLGKERIKSYPQYNSATKQYDYYTFSMGINNTSFLTTLKNLGIVRMRAMVAQTALYPIQGIVTPTVFKLGSRVDGTAYAQTSWFARPYIDDWDRYSPIDYDDPAYGAEVEFKHCCPIPEYGPNLLVKISNSENYQFSSNAKNMIRAEIQSNYGNDAGYPGEVEDGPIIASVSPADRNRFIDIHKNSFYVDWNLVDMFSPDISENTNVKEWKFRIVGYAEKYANMGYKAISSTNITTTNSGANNIPVIRNMENGGPKMMVTGPYWTSSPYKFNGNEGTRATDITVGYMIFPWHKTGSIINAPNGQSDVLTYNRTSNLQFCGASKYYRTISDVWTPRYGCVADTFKESENIPIMVKNDDYDGSVTYKGNVDEVISPRVLDVDSCNPDGYNQTTPQAVYPILALPTDENRQFNLSSINAAHIIPSGNTVFTPNTFWGNAQALGTQAVRMKYKSTPHAVIKLNNTETETVILPVPGNGTFVEKHLNQYEVWRTYNKSPDVPTDYTEVNVIENLEWVLVSAQAMSFARQSGYEPSSIVAIHNSVLNVDAYLANTQPQHAGKKYFFIKSFKPQSVGASLIVDYDNRLNAEGVPMQMRYQYAEGSDTYENYKDAFTGILLQYIPMSSAGSSDKYWTYAGTEIAPRGHSGFREQFNLFQIIPIGSTSGMRPSFYDLVSEVYFNVRWNKLTTFRYMYYGSSGDKQELYSNAQDFTRVTYDITNEKTGVIGNDWVVDKQKFTDKPCFWIGELYPESDIQIDETNMQFIPCSDIAEISMNRLACVGDCWFGRTDLLRVYAASDTDENSVIDIVSAKLVSSTNPHARYDRNRGKTDNTTVSPLNFNLYNEVYNQKDNFYSSGILNKKLFNNTEFKNSVIWSLPKNPGAEIDNWTHLYASNILYLDGDKGEVRSLNRLGNSIISFQDRGIAEIMYNSYTQLQGTQGLPIELANSGKVDGYRYLYNNSGCINKWSIIERDSSLYFIDDLAGSINALTPQLVSLSDTKGFKTWINQTASQNIWNPLDYKNVRGFYDKSLNDVYWSSGDYCLVYSELLGQFMSFMPYRKTSMIENFNGHLVSEKGGELWYLQEGDYNSFYGQQENYSIEYRVTPDPYGDKIFTNIEYRSDMFDGDKEVPFITYDRLDVFNEYQSGSSKLETRPRATIANLKKRLRIWRADIPRDTKDKTTNPYGLNRMRNPWISLRLTKDNSNGNHLRNIFHDLVVYYYE